MEWTIQDLGSVGELVGAIAVVITLAYLARQIRDQNQANQIAVFEGLMDGFNELNLMMASESDVYGIFIKGLNQPDELDDDDAGRFHSLMRIYTNNYSKMYRAYLRGAIEEDAWTKYAAEGAQILESPGGRKYLEGYEKGSWEYIEAVRAHLPEDSVIDISLGRQPVRRGT